SPPASSPPASSPPASSPPASSPPASSPPASSPPASSPPRRRPPPRTPGARPRPRLAREVAPRRLACQALRPDQGVDGGRLPAVPLDGAAHPFGPQDAQPGQPGGDRLGGVQHVRARRAAHALGQVGQVVADNQQRAARDQRRRGPGQHPAEQFRAHL